MCGAPASAQGALLAMCCINLILEVGSHCLKPKSIEHPGLSTLEAALLAGWVDPGALNFAAMTGLQPSTRYYYIVGDLVRPQGLLHVGSGLSLQQKSLVHSAAHLHQYQHELGVSCTVTIRVSS